MSLLALLALVTVLGHQLSIWILSIENFKTFPRKKKFGSEKEEKIIIVSFERYAQTNKQTDKLAYYIID